MASHIPAHKVVVVGAGITGLALARELAVKGVDVQLYEASQHIGGNIHSHREGDYLLELGPNSLRMTDFLHGYLDSLGMLDRLLPASKAAKHRFVLRDGQLMALPGGPLSFLLSGQFSWAEKRRIWGERKRPFQDLPDETVDGFFRRRFGDTIADYLLAPFVSGIYAGDPRQLNMRATFPQLAEMERSHGSVIRGMMKAKRDRHRGIVSFREGLGELPARLAQDLEGRLHPGMPLEALQPLDGKGFELRLGGQQLRARQVVLALPAHTLAPILQEQWPQAGAALDKVQYPPVTLVHSVFKRDQVRHALNGFGALNNHLEDPASLGTIFHSTVFPGRCPEGEVLLTSFIGGARFPEKALQDDAAIRSSLLAEMQRLLGVKGEPIMLRITRYPRSIPQYTADIRDAHHIADTLEQSGLYLAGNWRGGISVINCLERAQELCEKLEA